LPNAACIGDATARPSPQRGNVGANISGAVIGGLSEASGLGKEWREYFAAAGLENEN
jgi:hypothetical protein